MNRQPTNFTPPTSTSADSKAWTLVSKPIGSLTPGKPKKPQGRMMKVTIMVSGMGENNKTPYGVGRF